MLERKVALVTGAAKGIGRAIALVLSKEGYTVVINYISSSEKAYALKAEIEALGGSALVIKGDVSIQSEAEEVVNTTMKELGKIDVLVNNAGITRDNLIIRMSEEDFDKVLQVNLKGTFIMAKLVGKEMIKKRCGKIINISSVVGITGNAGQTNYAASKAGVIGLTKSLAKELASRGINVNAVAPGFIETDMTEKLPEKARLELTSSIPLKRLGKPEDVASVVAFLASNASDYITGQVLKVDGGMVI